MSMSRFSPYQQRRAADFALLMGFVSGIFVLSAGIVAAALLIGG